MRPAALLDELDLVAIRVGDESNDGRAMFHRPGLTQDAAAALAGELPIIAVGGVTDGATAKAKLAAGAQLVQVYSGLVYRGPGLVKDCVAATRSHA
jgi:dihydroorotate dehydrogenase